MTSDKLKTLAAESGITLSETQISLLAKFVELFTEKNKVINLTKINSEEEFLIKHILDSLFVGKFIELKSGIRLADIGTGGGLPGLPLIITNQKTQFTLIDSVQKKIRCAEEFAKSLGLKNVEGISERLEVIGKDKKFREQFDVVVSRALAPLPVLLELAIPLVKTGGIFVAMKGPNYEEELLNAANAQKLLKVAYPQIHKYELPENMGTRYLLVYNKTTRVPDVYPRRVGVPNGSPL